MTHTTPQSTYVNGFAAHDNLPPVNLPTSDDELVIAYSMVAALYKLMLRWSHNEAFDEQAQSITASAERLLLRTDVVRRILRLAWSERRQEFMVDHIELLEQQKLNLLKTLQPFAQLVEASHDDPDWERHIGNTVSQADFARAQVVYKTLMAIEDTPKCGQSASNIQ